MNDFARNICKLKEKFVTVYKGTSHIHELLPTKKTDFLPIDEKHISLLHTFMKNNPIYENSFELTFFDTKFIGIIFKYCIFNLLANFTISII